MFSIGDVTGALPITSSRYVLFSGLTAHNWRIITSCLCLNGPTVNICADGNCAVFYIFWKFALHYTKSDQFSRGSSNNACITIQRLESIFERHLPGTEGLKKRCIRCIVGVGYTFLKVQSYQDISAVAASIFFC